MLKKRRFCNKNDSFFQQWIQKLNESLSFYSIKYICFCKGSGDQIPTSAVHSKAIPISYAVFCTSRVLHYLDIIGEVMFFHGK